MVLVSLQRCPLLFLLILCCFTVPHLGDWSWARKLVAGAAESQGCGGFHWGLRWRGHHGFCQSQWSFWFSKNIWVWYLNMSGKNTILIMVYHHFRQKHDHFGPIRASGSPGSSTLPQAQRALEDKLWETSWLYPKHEWKWEAFHKTAMKHGKYGPMDQLILGSPIFRQPAFCPAYQQFGERLCLWNCPFRFVRVTAAPGPDLTTWDLNRFDG